MNIPDEAVEAAAKGLASANLRSRPWNELAEDAQNHFRRDAKAALEAAAPYMHDRAAEDRLLAMAWSEGAMAATANPAGARLANPFRKDTR